MIIFIICSLSGLLFSCNSSDDEDDDLVGDWVQRSTFEGNVRSNSAACTVNGKGYVGTGYDGYNRLKDFWEYDPELNYWEQKADFPGQERNEAVAFAANGKVYLGTGYTGSTYCSDFYEYDPISNTWDSIADFMGSARYGAVAFTLYNKGYVGTGFDGNNKKDFYKYDPLTGTWEKIVSIPGDKRIDANAFVVSEKGYVCAGLNNGTYLNDTWEYDPIIENWTQKADLAVDDDDDGTNDRDVRRYGACSFSINTNGYVCCGYYGSLTNSTWEFNPQSNTWTQRADFEGSGRMDGIALTIGNRGFILCGKNGNYRYDDMWEFLP